MSLDESFPSAPPSKRQSTIDNPRCPFVSRGGDKLAAALDAFHLDVTGSIVADLGSHVGGFVDCLLLRGARRVYSIDTSYGTLAWRLRKDPRVVVRERTNAMHVTLPEPMELVTVDVGWTRQERILPNVERMLAAAGQVVTLLKPHYEAPSAKLAHGVLPEALVDTVVGEVLARIESLGWKVRGTVPSPLPGHGGNREVFAWLHRA